MGATMPEALAARDILQNHGFEADVICVTSADLLFRALQARTGRGDGDTSILDEVFAYPDRTPMVTVVDGHPHSLTFLATIRGSTHVGLGVTKFGQSGSLEDVYEYHGIAASAIAGAALDLID